MVSRSYFAFRLFSCTDLFYNFNLKQNFCNNKTRLYNLISSRTLNLASEFTTSLPADLVAGYSPPKCAREASSLRESESEPVSLYSHYI